MAEQQNTNRKVKIELPRDPSAIYANMVMITHTSNEVIFDFMQVLPNDERVRLQKRVMMTPAHSKLFLKALQDNMVKFEAKHGEIQTTRHTLADQLFGAVRTGQDDEEDE
jgi:hypothetical protein